VADRFADGSSPARQTVTTSMFASAPFFAAAFRAGPLIGGCILIGMLLVDQAFAAEPLEPAPEGSFSIVVLPDTQAYRGMGTKAEPDSTDPVTNRIFRDHVEWVAGNLRRQRIAFVSHVGDIVDKNNRSEWQVARECMDVLHGRVPYGISVGNHDMTSEGDSRLFQEFFPASRFEGFDWYGGSFEGSAAGPQVSGNNANSFQRFSAGGLDFLFLHLECNAPDDVLRWANRRLEEHPNHIALITSHMGWGPRDKPTEPAEYVTGKKGRMTWSKIHGVRGNTPQQMWDKCYRRHANLIAVFSGDQSRTAAYRAVSAGDHGNPVHELLQDYGTGYLRVYRFTPTDDELLIRVITIHSATGELCDGVPLVPDRDEHQFELRVPLPTNVSLNR